MFNTLRKIRPGFELKPITRLINPTRSVSGFFKNNLMSLFGSYEESDKKSDDVEIQIKPIERVHNIEGFYSTFTSRGIIPRGLPLPYEMDRKSMVKFIPSAEYDYTTGVRNRPALGSFVEIQKDDGHIDIGIVKTIQENSYYNTEISMITVNGNIVHFKPTDVSFHLYKMIKSENIRRFETSNFLKAFIRVSQDSMHNDQPLYSVAQAWFAKENTPVEVDLQKVVEILNKHSLKQKKQPLDIYASIFAAHRKLASDPINWFVEKNPDSQYTDSLPKFKYYSNSYKTIKHLEISMNLRDEPIHKISRWFKYSLESFSEQNELSKPPYAESVLELLKHYVSYPHHDFKRVVDLVWSEVGSGNSYRALDIKLLVDELCSNFEINDTIIPGKMNDVYSKINVDNFEFLREPVTSRAFAIPSIQSGKQFDLAFSLEKQNHCWILQIHILDLGSHIKPETRLSNLLFQRVKSLTMLGKNHPLFDDDVFNGFTEGSDALNKAITLTLEYPLKSDIGWDNAKLLSIKLTELNDMKLLKLDELNKLVNKGDGSILGFFRTPIRENFTFEDDSTILSIYRLLEIWRTWRTSKGCLDYDHPKKTIKDGELIEVAKTLGTLEFIRKETTHIISEYLIPVTQKNNCPLLIHSQSTLPPLKDSIEITPNKFSIPNYTAKEYKEFTLFPNAQGQVTFMTYICGLKLLDKEVVTTEPLPYVSKGLSNGLVHFMNPLNDMEAILNQWQVINMLKAKYKSRQPYNFELNEQLQDFKMANPKDLQTTFSYKINPIKEFQKYLYSKQDRIEKLQWVLDNKTEWLIFKCIITEPSTFPELAKAYCFELDLEVEILLNPNIVEVEIGDQLICTKVVQLDPIESRLILQS